MENIRDPWRTRVTRVRDDAERSDEEDRAHMTRAGDDAKRSFEEERRA
jgi:hypothetical protein